MTDSKDQLIANLLTLTRGLLNDLQVLSDSGRYLRWQTKYATLHQEIHSAYGGSIPGVPPLYLLDTKDQTILWGLTCNVEGQQPVFAGHDYSRLIKLGLIEVNDGVVDMIEAGWDCVNTEVQRKTQLGHYRWNYATD